MGSQEGFLVPRVKIIAKQAVNECELPEHLLA